MPTSAFSLNLTHAQRKVLAEVLPNLAGRLKLDEAASRMTSFTRKELQDVAAKCKATMSKAANGTVRNSLRRIMGRAYEALEKHKESSIGQIPASEGLCQFKISLAYIAPPIWRRIQTKDCTLDQLHEHIQTAMGWTNSHLHHFRIGKQLYGDPMLMGENFGEMGYKDSTTTKLSDILPKSGRRFRCEYEYDFGDGWVHEILFEGRPEVKKGGCYPLCLEGQRACPPEDVGGPFGYQDYLEALADPKHERHDEFMEWSGPFDPEAFDAKAATREMRKGLPNWREME
jgi:hypothetical protein